MSAINAGAYLCPGADVLVVDDGAAWLGRILSIGDRDPVEANVAVLDPRGNETRHVGQRVLCTLHQLRSAPHVEVFRERFPLRELEMERFGDPDEWGL